MEIVELDRVASPVLQLLEPTTIDLPACLVHTNLQEFDWDFTQHLLQKVYQSQSRDLPAVQLWRFPDSTRLAVPTGEDLIPVVGGLVLKDQSNPGWGTTKLNDVLAGCATEININRTAVLIGRYGLRTWGHWLGELLPKMACLDAVRPGQYSFVLPTDITRDPHLRTLLESLQYYGIGTDRLALLEPGRRYHFQELLAVSSVWSERKVHPGAVEAMRRVVPAQPFGNRIALLRRESATRRIANVDELLPLLNAAGFRVVEIGQLSFRAQVSIFQRASAVISVLGSGLTGLIYAPPGVKIATLCPIGWADDFFFALMQNRSARLADIRGPSMNDDPRGVAASSFTITPAALERGLRALGLIA